MLVKQVFTVTVTPVNDQPPSVTIRGDGIKVRRQAEFGLSVRTRTVCFGLYKARRSKILLRKYHIDTPRITKTFSQWLHFHTNKYTDVLMCIPNLYTVGGRSAGTNLNC